MRNMFDNKNWNSMRSDTRGPRQVFKKKKIKKKFRLGKKMKDVLAVSTETNKVLWVDGPKDEKNAEAIINMAIMRQGVRDRFFTTAKPGKYKDGDSYWKK